MIDKLRHAHPVDKLCPLMAVAKSGYQAWSRGKVIPARRLEDARFVTAIKAAHQRGRGIYRPKKIQTELASQGIVARLNGIKRLRKLHGIRCTYKKKFRVTTDSRHPLPMAENLLNRQFAPTAPNRVWVADITYIPTNEGWLLLAAIKDLYTCEIVGWAMDKQMTKQLVVDALRAAYWRKKPQPGLLHHSDRGSQYCSQAYRALQVSYGMQTSMSCKGNCWDTQSTRRRKASSVRSKRRACIITVLPRVRKRNGWCLSILKSFTPRRKSPWGITASDVTLRSTISHPLIVQNNSTKQRPNWLHSPSNCPCTKSDLAQLQLVARCAGNALARG